jgi:signal peptidase I
LALVDEQKCTAVPLAEVEVRESLLESIASMSIVLVIGLFVMTFIFQNFVIPSASMVKTLLIGDHVLVDRTTLAPQTKWMPLVHYRSAKRGDIIVFLKPHPETPDLILVKRLIGIAGDRIHLRNGVLYLNGVAQNEAYAAMPAYDGDPNHVYQSYRDDSPQDLEGISAQALWCSPWVTTVLPPLTAASGVSFRLRTSSDVLSSSTGPSILLQTRSTSNRSVNA